MQVFSFSASLVVGGGTKVIYGVLSFRSFRRSKPPEEDPPIERITNIAL